VVAKALAVFGLAAIRIHQLDRTLGGREAAIEALELLHADRSAGPHAWGYPFPVQTRWSYYAANTPNVIVTSFAVAALAEAAHVLGSDRFAARARHAACWILNTLFDEGQGIFVYHPTSNALIHNANVLGARAVRQGGLDSPTARSAVERAIAKTLGAQQPNGSWPYGEGHGLAFADSFHTGFVLDCLATFGRDIPGVTEALDKGARFYVGRFFGPAGEARLWPDRRFPEDAHAAGTGLSTIAALAAAGIVPAQVGVAPASRVLGAVIKGDQCIARRYRWGASRVWYPRWCDAHVALGLASYARVARAAHDNIRA